MIRYLRQWRRDWYYVFTNELRMIFCDSGVMVIFFLAGLAYPLIYGIVYSNGTVDDTPVAVVDLSHSTESRRFIRKMDATREISIAYTCTDMEEAARLMRERRINGIVLFPEDYGDAVTCGRQARISTYADMSSFLYYKNLLMAVNHVMLSEMHDIQIQRFSAMGISGQSAIQLVEAMPYEENIPYNRGFAYGFFFIPAALMLVIQQTMFYGSSMLAGTKREHDRNALLMPELKGRDISRTLLGRGAAYYLIYTGLSIYIAVLVPRIFGLPQFGRFGDILVFLLFYLAACVTFSLTFSSLITRRETVFVLFLFMSPVCLFLTGFSWPETAFPAFWRLFSYIFPSTFAAHAFINLNSAGCTLAMIAPQLKALAIQTVIYYTLAWTAAYLEHRDTTSPDFP